MDFRAGLGGKPFKIFKILEDIRRDVNETDIGVQRGAKRWREVDRGVERCRKV